MGNSLIKQLSKSNIVITGGSRDIGGGIVLELAKAGASILSVFRSKPDRAQKIADDIKNGGGKAPILLMADLVTPEGIAAMFGAWKKEFKNNIDILILCASGATMEINVDANMALVDKFLEIRKERLKKGEKLADGTIIFLQSEPGHVQRVIDGVFDFLDYYRDKVGPAKRAGEDAFRTRLGRMAELGVRGITVCPPEVTDTFNMKLFELQNKEARSKSRELSGKLGTRDFVTIAEVAKRVHEIIEDQDIKNGHLELFTDVSDGLTVLSAIYGDEAIYVHTYQKTGENSGTGRMIVNPALWKREAEPTFAGELISKSTSAIESDLKITSDHLRGHFRSDIAAVFPGHKSIRTAYTALGRFFSEKFEVDEDAIVLKKYLRVKFKGTVIPGQTLATKVKLSGKSERSATGDGIQTVDDKPTMEISGMVVEKLNNPNESVLLLDQLVEAAAQTVGMHVLGSAQDADVLPLFHSTGEAEIFQDVGAGDNLLIKLEKARVIKTGMMNIFSADALIVRKLKDSEETIASIKSLSGVILPKVEVLKKLI